MIWRLIEVARTAGLYDADGLGEAPQIRPDSDEGEARRPRHVRACRSSCLFNILEVGGKDQVRERIGPCWTESEQALEVQEVELD